MYSFDLNILGIGTHASDGLLIRGYLPETGIRVDPGRRREAPERYMTDKNREVR